MFVKCEMSKCVEFSLGLIIISFDSSCVCVCGCESHNPIKKPTKAIVGGARAGGIKAENTNPIESVRARDRDQLMREYGFFQSVNAWHVKICLSLNKDHKIQTEMKLLLILISTRLLIILFEQPTNGRDHHSNEINI